MLNVFVITESMSKIPEICFLTAPVKNAVFRPHKVFIRFIILQCSIFLG